MRRVLILAALGQLLFAQGLSAQGFSPQGRGPGIPRSNCGFGEGLALLRDVEREAGERVPGVAEGRARGERAVSGLNTASSIFRGCGCARLGQLTAEAASVAGSAPSEASVARLTEVFRLVRFRVQLAREFTEGQACR